MHAENVFVFDDSGEICAVAAERDGLAMRFCGGEGMREVEEGAGRNVGQETRRARDGELIPAHVGKLHGGGKGSDATRKKIQTV